MKLKPLEYYLDGIYETEIIEEDAPDGTIYVARLKAYPRCLAQAANPDVALSRLAHFKEVMIRSRYERGVPPPEPDHKRE